MSGLGSTMMLRAAAAPRRRAIFATLMTALAGFLDAVGYVQLQHFYVSFMSGNSTQFGMAVARANWSDVLLAGVVIGSFVVGACLATIICEVSNRFEILAVLNSELLVFLVALALAVSAYDRTALVLVALAMGAQNTLHQIVAGADVGKGFITGTLFALGQSLAFWLRRRKPISQAASNLLSWLAFIGGAAVGTLVLGAIGLIAVLAVIATIYALLIAAIFLAVCDHSASWHCLSDNRKESLETSTEHLTTRNHKIAIEEQKWPMSALGGQRTHAHNQKRLIVIPFMDFLYGSSSIHIEFLYRKSYLESQSPA